MWPLFVTFSWPQATSQWTNPPRLPVELSHSFQYFILPCHILRLTHPKSSKPIKCLVLYFSCSLRPLNIQRISLEHSGLTSPAFQITLKWHSAPLQKHMHISGAVTLGWRKGRTPWRLAKARPGMMTHTTTKCNVWRCWSMGNTSCSSYRKCCVSGVWLWKEEGGMNAGN